MRESEGEIREKGTGFLLHRRWGRIFIAISSLALLGVLAITIFPADAWPLDSFFAPEKALKRRARGFMESMLARDWASAASYLKEKGAGQAIGSRTHILKSYEIEDLSVNGREGSVRVRVKYKLFLPQIAELARLTQEQEYSLKWERSGFRWYLHAARPPTLADLAEELAKQERTNDKQKSTNVDIAEEKTAKEERD